MPQFPLLLADSGGTKTDWVLVYGPGIAPLALASEGWSATGRGSDQTAAALREWLSTQPALSQQPVSEVHFYGAGMAQPGAAADTEAALRLAFPQATVQVCTDLLGAARAVAGHQPAVVAITGTGSVAGRYNGHTITHLSGGYGYLITDLGSAAHIGQCLLAALLRGRVSQVCLNHFQAQFSMGAEAYTHSLYASATPQRGLAAVTGAFYDLMQSELWVHSVFEQCLTHFWRTDILPLQVPGLLPVGLVGSLAQACSAMHCSLAAQYGQPEPTIIARPVDALTKYHLTYE